jgi:glycosyltransferase involved in cell wall biosynthesis
MEAMAAGVPVVATRIAGVPELVDDGVSGFLVAPGDVTALAERVAALLDDADLRNLFGAAGRAKVEKEFNIATEAERLCRILTAVVGGQPAPAPAAAAQDVTSRDAPVAWPTTAPASA